ncbi:extracellular solute-binding protein [Paenibacillus sp. Y412MC10]|uniref:ABC transporter substrate-binding protein n=1 Tax=Geobacillus sp. (strain Y412MC10) TaxID=481743 RepID=UPI0011AB6870|nr:extracellular solute-binding protein [Paenibacillus sp. Y412MC10]
MNSKTLRVALIDGPAYAPLYACLSQFSQQFGIQVDIGFKGTHPELNRHVQECMENGLPSYDLISTHTKYAPSQARYLYGLDQEFTAEELEDFSPALLDLARVQGKLMSIPRNFDARLLFYRRDRLEELGLSVPETWEELAHVASSVTEAGYTGFVFPGMESGLFGTFFELLISGGGQLFDEQLQPMFASEAGVEALQKLRQWYQWGWTPKGLPDMHYDEVSASFRQGESTMVTDWPGYFGLLSESPIANVFDLALTPKSASGRRAVYCGSHSFAIPASSEHVEEAIVLLKFITSPEAQAMDADQGHVPVRQSIMKRLKREALPNSIAARRWSLLEETIATSVIIPPKFPTYPTAEDILWQALRRCIIGELSEHQALALASEQIQQLIRS